MSGIRKLCVSDWHVEKLFEFIWKFNHPEASHFGGILGENGSQLQEICVCHT